MTVTEHVTVRGVELAYRSVGEGRPLVLVHGNFASKRWFTPLLNTVQEGWQLIALDLPNFGDSDAMPETISIGAYAHYLQDFLAALKLHAPVLLGHSLGGAVVQVLVARQPDLPQGLILLNSAPPNGLKTPEENYQALELFKHNRDLLAKALSATMPSHKPGFFNSLVEDALRMNAAAFTGNARALEQYDVTAYLKDVTCPVMVIRGQLDYLITESMARQTGRAFPHAQLELLEGIGHSPQLENPVRFQQFLESFLKGVTS